MEIFQRPLTNAELRWLRLVHKPRRIPIWRLALAGLVIFGTFAVLTALVSNVGWQFIAIFWSSIGSFMMLALYLQELWHEIGKTKLRDCALALNSARVTQIQSSAVVEIEETEDEGPTYAFQFDTSKIVFISGQEFYESARFPNSNFSLIEISVHSDKYIGYLIENNGSKIMPMRKISGVSANQLRRPGHLQVVDGSLDELETILAV